MESTSDSTLSPKTFWTRKIFKALKNEVLVPSKKTMLIKNSFALASLGLICL